jgi:hypothetical protein
MVGFLQTIRLAIVAAFTQLFDKTTLFLDSAGARFSIGTTHGKLHCTVKARVPPEPRWLSNNRTFC